MFLQGLTQVLVTTKGYIPLISQTTQVMKYPQPLTDSKVPNLNLMWLVFYLPKSFRIHALSDTNTIKIRIIKISLWSAFRQQRRCWSAYLWCTKSSRMGRHWTSYSTPNKAWLTKPMQATSDWFNLYKKTKKKRKSRVLITQIKRVVTE